MRKNISQAEAFAMKRKIALLEEQNQKRKNAYCKEWPEGVHVHTLNIEPIAEARLRTARRLGFSLIATMPNDGRVEFYAIRTE